MERFGSLTAVLVGTSNEKALLVSVIAQDVETGLPTSFLVRTFRH